MATKQRREDQEFKKSLRVSALDMSFDTGKVKKLKIKKAIIKKNRIHFKFLLTKSY
jgi:hypothetical protein